MAGFAFAYEQARNLTKELANCFGPYGGFHMKHLVHKKRAFKAISDSERDDEPTPEKREALPERVRLYVEKLEWELRSLRVDNE